MKTYTTRYADNAAKRRHRLRSILSDSNYDHGNHGENEMHLKTEDCHIENEG